MSNRFDAQGTVRPPHIFFLFRLFSYSGVRRPAGGASSASASVYSIYSSLYEYKPIHESSSVGGDSIYQSIQLFTNPRFCFYSQYVPLSMYISLSFDPLPCFVNSGARRLPGCGSIYRSIHSVQLSANLLFFVFSLQRRPASSRRRQQRHIYICSPYIYRYVLYN